MRKRQAVFPILMVLVISALALISSSFAWFSVSNVANVSMISASAQSSGVEFLISNTGDRFYSRNLNLEGVNNNGHLINPRSLYQVSTIGSLDENGLIRFFDASYDGYLLYNHDTPEGEEVDQDQNFISTKEDKSIRYIDKKYKPTEEGYDKTVNYDDLLGSFGYLTQSALGDNGKPLNDPKYEAYTIYGQTGKTYGEAYEANDATYIVMDFYFYLDRVANIYLYDGSEILAGGHIDNRSGSATYGEYIATSLEKSLRVAFVYLGSIESDTKTLAGGIDDTKLTGTKSVKIWEPYETTTIRTTKEMVDDGEGNLVEVETPVLDDKGNIIRDKNVTYGVTNECTDLFEAHKLVENITAVQNTYTSKELIVTNQEDTSKNVALLENLVAGYHKIRVYVWLEGNDPDCTSSVSSKELSISISFFAKQAE